MAEEKVKAEKTKKVKPAKKKGKISTYFKELRGEMKKVTWYSAHDTFQNSTWVVIALVILTVVIGGVNYGFSQLIGLLGKIVR